MFFHTLLFPTSYLYSKNFFSHFVIYAIYVGCFIFIIYILCYVLCFIFYVVRLTLFIHNLCVIYSRQYKFEANINFKPLIIFSK